MSQPDRLVAAELSELLGQVKIGCRIIVLESTASTNQFFAPNALAGIARGICRLCGAPEPPAGPTREPLASAAHLGLWFSLLLRPNIPLAASACLTNWGAQAIAATIESETGLKRCSNRLTTSLSEIERWLGYWWRRKQDAVWSSMR